MTRTSTLNTSQPRRPKRLALGIVTNLTGTADVVDATTADFRMLRVHADIFTAVPATGALGEGRLDDFELETRHFGGHGVGRGLDEWRQARGGGDQHEAQFVAQLGQVGAQAFLGKQGDFGLQVATDGLGRTLDFQLLVHGHFHRHPAFPVCAAQFEVGRQFGQAFVPGVEHHGLVTLARQVFPQFVGGEGQDRRDPAHQRFGDVIQRGLRRAARLAVGAGGVLAVLDDVEVETAQLLHAEVVNLRIDIPEAVFTVVLLQLALQQQSTVHGPTVQGEHFLGRQDVGGRVETGQVRQHEACGITDTTVGIGAALQDLLRHGHLARIIGRGDPQAHDVGAQGVIDLLRRDHIAQGLGHLAAVFVDGETVGQQFAVRCVVVDGTTGQQRRVEPATVLVRTFQVQVGARAGFVTHRVRTAQHVPMGGAGVEPHIEGVADLVVQRRFVAQQLAAFLVEEERDRHAPVALAGDAPVRTVGDHRVQARLAPGRDELGAFDGFDRAVAQGVAAGRFFIHADEPLRGGAVDQRGLVAPAVHVAVLDGIGLHQRANFTQLVDDHLVGFEDELAAKELQRWHVNAIALHWVDDVIVDHAVFFADHEVVDAIGRRAVNHTGTRTQFNIVSQVHRRQAVVERVTEIDQFQRGAGGGRDHRTLQFVASQTVLDHLFGQHQQAITDIHQGVREFRVYVQRLVGGDGPRGGGPDHDGGRLGQACQAKGLGQLGVVGDREGHVDGRGLLVFVLDFRLSQGRTAVEAPVHGLEALEHETALDDFGQRADFTGFVLEVHGFVRVGPVTQDTQADELGLLPFDLLGGIGTAQLAGFIGAQVLAVGHFDFVFDRQAVAVPARDIRRVETRKGLRADDHVLENLVQRMTDVNRAVGVRRAVVQDEFRTILANLAQLSVQANTVPALQDLRFALWQAGLHWEGGVRKV